LAARRQFRSAHTTHRFGINLAALHSPSKFGISTLGSGPFGSGSPASSLVSNFALTGTFGQTDATAFSPRPFHHLTELAVPGRLPFDGTAFLELYFTLHGYALLLNSKWGPSGKDFQSPPQTIATFCLKAACFMIEARLW
jgi:hypothetical protein